MLEQTVGNDYSRQFFNFYKSQTHYPPILQALKDSDSLDWKDYGAESIVSTVCNHKHLGSGSIILMHNGAKYTPAALDTVITNLKAQGYELVPLSQLLLDGQYGVDYEMDHEGRQKKE